MATVAAEAPQPPLALVQALEQLSGPLDPLDASTQLQAVQDACTALVALVEGGGRLPTDLLENALEAVARGLAAARQQLEAAAGQLAAARSGGWACALLAAADACMHSEAWHAAWHADAGGGAQAYKRTVELAREMLRQDLLPLLSDASAQQGAATGFCLAPQYRALLTMGRTAADIVGMRDPRHRRPGLRNFSVLNVLWNGIQKLWTCVPQEVRADMERQGLGGAEAAGAVLGFIRRDIRACHTLLDPGVGKLLQYWVQKARAVLGSFPSAAPACWSGALEVPLAAHQELALLAAAASGGSTSAAALGEALREQLLPRAVQLLVACLSGTTAEDKLRVMLDELRMRLGAGEQGGQAVHALRTMLHLLHSSPSMPPLARHHCVALLGSVLDALPGPCAVAALQSAELREAVADAALVFLATCCHAAATAPSDEALTPCERQLAAQTWERCQQQLFLHALQPHPLTAHVLGCVWSDLAAASSEALLKLHISAMHDLLHAAAAAAAAGGHRPPSPLYSQLLGLLACLLAAAPTPTQDAFFAHFLQALGKMSDDACQLACLAADLRLAALVDSASGSAAAAPQVQGVLATLFRWLTETAPTLMKRVASVGAGGQAASTGAAEAETLYLAWLLEALHCTAAYFAATGGPQGEEGARVLKTTASRIAFLLARAVERGMFSLAGPCLAALVVLPPVEASELEQVVPALAACQQHPDLAAAVAGVVPALARCPAPHAHVLQTLLLQEGALLQHLGMEAFCSYAQTCPPENVVLAVPPALKDPATGALLESMVSLLTQYTQRSAARDEAPAEAEVAAWAAALRQEALGAAGALRRVLEARRSQDPGDAHPASGSPPPGEAGDGALAAAVQAVAASIQHAEAAMQAASLDPSSAQLLRQCAERLAHLLGSAA